MALQLRAFADFVQQQAAAVQASATQLLDFTTGSAVRAIVEANASVALWMQWLILLVLRMTRAATSIGADLDSWMLDFGLLRLPAVAATGLVTFARFTTGQTALILPGAQVKTADGLQVYAVTTDTTNAYWNVALVGYLVPAATASITVPVIALVAGLAGNAQAGTVTIPATSISGIDTVTNSAAFTNGVNAEGDAAFRARFALFINTRSLATVSAVSYAITSLQQGLSFTIQENVTTGGAYQPGNFLVVVDDGTGAPSSALKTQVGAAVETVRPVGSTYSVLSPTVITANVALTITVAAGYDKPSLLAPVATAITAFIAGRGLGVSLPYSRIAQIAYDVSPGITNVTGVLVNSATADLGGTPSAVVRAGTVVVS